MIRRALALALLVLPGCALAPSEEAPRFAPSPAAPPGSPGAPTFPAAGASAADGSIQLAFAPGATDDELSALDDDDEEPDAGVAATPGAPPGPGAAAPTSPALALSDAEIEQRYHQDPASLGPISVGRASAGLLVNGVQMQKSERIELLDPGHAWGTRETVDALVHIIDRVNERYPGTGPLSIGHLSARNGGHLSPHVSHQSGRDADVGYYYRTAARAFVRANEQNLDLPRTWALVRAAVKETDVEMILVDRGVQKLLADYASANGEDPAFVDAVFQIRGRNARAPVRHVKGHDNHLHFRFHNPVAEEMGRRVARFVRPPAPAVVHASQAEVAGVVFMPHRARSGDTLVILAKRYGTTVEEIQRVNGLKSNALRAGVVYRIPQKAAPRAPAGKPAVAHKAAPVKPGNGHGASAPQR
jgi:penicillin-insensitive murein endopeptidase